MCEVTELARLIKSMRPMLTEGEFVFLTRPGESYGTATNLTPIACCAEQEGLTLVVPKEKADRFGEAYVGGYRRITLQVHSSLDAVGLTAKVATALAQQNISANVVAAYYHDHLFVPSDRATDAIEVLNELAARGA